MKIETISEFHPKKLELNINKSETGLKKLDFNINVNEDKIDDMNDKKVVHPSDDLTDYDYNNIENYKTQHERTNQNNSYYTLADK